MTESPRRARLSTSARVTGIVAAAAVLVVMIGTALIVSPAGTPLRSSVRDVALPYFGQTWRVFAPNILKTNRDLEIRAQWRDDNGELQRSDWVSITDIEQRSVAGNAAPSRIIKVSWNASSTLLQRYNRLDEVQRERVRDTFIEAHDGGFRPIPVEALIADLGEDDPDVIRFLRVDYMLMRYATLFATAGFDKQVERVQWRVVRERPNDFTHRFDDEPQFAPNIVTFGWRQSNISIDADTLQEYRDVIARYGGQGAFRRAAANASD